MQEPEKAKEEPAKEEAKAVGRCRFQGYVGRVLNAIRFGSSIT